MHSSKAFFFSIIMLLATLAGCTDPTRGLDTDGDGVDDALDLCPDTDPTLTVNADGCADNQLDDDGDGIMNDRDLCPTTPPGTIVGPDGCALPDTDGDGVIDADDLCPNTPAGATVNADGCALTQLDTDGDGVNDADDACPNTAPGMTVDAFGCDDTDGDGVADTDDLCPNTPTGSSVNGNGCAQSQLDTDLDHVADSDDLCPNTPYQQASTAGVDSEGCHGGYVLAWGMGVFGGNTSLVAGLESDPEVLTQRVIQIERTDWGQAALRSDGIIYSWGLYAQQARTTDAVQLESTYGAYAALKEDGSVVSWGCDYLEPDDCDSWEAGVNQGSVASQLTSDVSKIYSNVYAFAALKSDGSVVTWGYGPWGGDSSSVSSDLASGVAEIYSTTSAFAALKLDGSVVTWGETNFGGDSTSVSSDLNSGVVDIYPSVCAFAALKDDDSVVTWGGSDYGGDSTSVSSDLSSNVVSVFTYSDFKSRDPGNCQGWNAEKSAFAALKSDGSVVTWGDSNAGGDSSSVSSNLDSDVEEIFASLGAFAALKSDGTVVVWGNPDRGGIGEPTSNDIEHIFSSREGFAAVKSDGSVSIWGSQSYFDSGNSHTVYSYDTVLGAHSGFMIQSDSTLEEFSDSIDCDDPTSDDYGAGISVICVPREIDGNIVSYGGSWGGHNAIIIEY